MEFLLFSVMVSQLSLIFRLAPTKLVPLSLIISFGTPLRFGNRERAAKKLLVLRSEQISKCTALLIKQTNTATHILMIFSNLIGLALMKKSQHKSTSILLKMELLYPQVDLP
jgi:hypothetical protein